MLLNTLQTKRLYRYAVRNGVGIIAVNADGDSLIHDTLLAAQQVDAPVIIETSLWQLQGKCFGHGDAMLGLAKYITDVALMASHPDFADLPVVFHIDHIPASKAVAILSEAVAGMSYRVWDKEMIVYPSSISFDATGLCDTDNVKCVIHVGRRAAGLGIPLSFEVEPGIEDEPTLPADAIAMVQSIEDETPGIVDLFAPAVGTVHGQTSRGANASFNPHLLGDVSTALERAFGRPIGLALHGSSGLSDTQLTEAVANGVIKINTCTLLLGARARAAHAYFAAHAADIQEGSRNMKEASKDPTVDSAVSAALVPLLAERMMVSRAAGHGRRAMAYILDGSR